METLEERLKNLNETIARYEQYPDVQDYLDLLEERRDLLKKKVRNEIRTETIS